MERRKILLGSGTVLATVLAGCSSSETDDPKSDDSDDDTFGNTDDKNGKDENGDDKKDDKKDDGKTDDENGKDDHQKIPGFKKGKIELDSDLLSIKDIKRDGRKLFVVIDTKTLDENKLAAELEHLANTHADAVVDPEKFAAEIDTVYWYIEHEKKLVTSFYVEVKWLIAYQKGKLSQEELLDKIAATAQE